MEIKLARMPLNLTRLFLEIIYFLQKDQLKVSDVIDLFIAKLKKSEINPIELFELISNYSFSLDLTKTKNLDQQKLVFQSDVAKKSFEKLIAYIKNYLFKVKYLIEYKDQDIILQYFDFIVRNPGDQLFSKMIVPQKEYVFIKNLYLYQNHLFQKNEDQQSFQTNVTSYNKEILLDFLKELSTGSVYHQNKDHKEINQFIGLIMYEKFDQLNLKKNQNDHENTLLREIKKIAIDKEEIDDIFNQFYQNKIKKDLIRTNEKNLIDLNLLQWLDSYPSKGKVPNPEILDHINDQIQNWPIDICEKEKSRLNQAKLTKSYVTASKTIEMINLRIKKIKIFERRKNIFLGMIFTGVCAYFSHSLIISYVGNEKIDEIKLKVVDQLNQAKEDVVKHLNSEKMKEVLPTQISEKIENMLDRQQPVKPKAEMCAQEKMQFLTKLLLSCSNSNPNCEMQPLDQSFNMSHFFQIYQDAETQINFFFNMKSEKPLTEVWESKEIELLSNLTTMLAKPKNSILILVALHQRDLKKAQKRNQNVLNKINHLFKTKKEEMKINYLIDAKIETKNELLSAFEAQRLKYLRNHDQELVESKKIYHNLDDLIGESVAVFTYPCWQELCSYLSNEKSLKISCNQIETVPPICKHFCDAKKYPSTSIFPDLAVNHKGKLKKNKKE